jgi:hypothetical protein
VYIFGDLRQLHKFELDRPIAPKAHQPNSNPAYTPHPLHLPSAPETAYGHPHRHRQRRPGSFVSATNFSDATVSIYSRDIQPFSMMPRYIETNPIQGPSICPMLLEYCSNPENDAEWLRQQDLQQERRPSIEPLSRGSSTSTATFIAPFCSPSTTDISGYWDSEEILSMNAHWYRLRAREDLEKLGCEAARRQPLAEFDFDGLPPAPNKSTSAMSGQNSNSEPPWLNNSRHIQDPESDGGVVWSSLDDESPSRWKWLLDFVDRVQTRCSLKKWGRGTDDSGPVFLGGIPPYLTSSRTSANRRLPQHTTFKSKSILSISTFATMDSDTTKRVKKRSRFILPAFAVPLTRVLSPIIVRSQWEIVIRSAAFAFFITWVVCASLLAIPQRQ